VGVRRAVFLVLVASVLVVAVLGPAAVFVGKSPSPESLPLRIGYGVLALAVLVGWTAFLVLRFLSALDERPSLAVAKVGIVLALLDLPAFLLDFWWIAQGQGTSMLASLTILYLTVAAIHATYLIQTTLEPRRTWLVVLTLAFDAAYLVLAIAPTWSSERRVVTGESIAAGERVGSLLFYGILAGTLLVEAFGRWDRMARRARETASPPPAPAHVRYCIACGSPRIVALADAARCDDCATQFHAELRPVAGN